MSEEAGASKAGEIQSQSIELRFENKYGETIVGWLLEAGDPTKAVVLCHGYLSNATHCHFERLAAALARHNISSFRFDHPMARKGTSQLTRPFRAANNWEEVEEIQGAIDCLTRHGYTPSCVLGHSKGGSNAFLYGVTAAHPVPLVICVAPRSNVTNAVFGRYGADIMERLQDQPCMPRTEPDGFQWIMTLEDFQERLGMDYYGMATQWPPSTRLTIIHGTADTTVPCAESEELAPLVPGASLVLVQDADHNFTAHAEQLERAVLGAVGAIKN